MAYRTKLTEDVLWGADEVPCRLLEIRAESRAELDRAMAAARAKKWFVWVAPMRTNSGEWGCVMEKGMPDSDSFDEALALADCNK